MLISLEELQSEYSINANGVLHVGAHYGEEAAVYDKLWPGVKVFWVEADPNSVRVLRKKLRGYRNHVVVAEVVTDMIKDVEFNIANNGESSSILEFGTHKKEHPEVEFTDKISLTSTTIDDLWKSNRIESANFLNLDIQGAELLALRGAQQYLDGVEYIYTEINMKPLYKDCALVGDMDKFLAGRGFSRLDTRLTRHGWGDAFYAKEL